MKLLELRQKSKLSQQEVAKKINMTQEKYSRLENNVTKIDVATLIAISDFYGVSLDYLCERPFNNNIGYIPENRKDLVKEIIELSDADAKEVQVFLKGYKAGKAGASEITIFN